MWISFRWCRRKGRLLMALGSVWSPWDPKATRRFALGVVGDLPFLKGWRVLKGGCTSIFRHLVLLPIFCIGTLKTVGHEAMLENLDLIHRFQGSQRRCRTLRALETFYFWKIWPETSGSVTDQEPRRYIYLLIYIYIYVILILISSITMWLDTRMTSNVTLIHGRISLNSIALWLPLVRSLTALGSLSTSSICKALSFSLSQFVRPSHQVVCFTQKHAVKPGISWISPMVTTAFLAQIGEAHGLRIR